MGTRQGSPRSAWLVAALLVVALGLSLAARLLAVSRDGANVLLFGAWAAALAFLFILGLRIPVQMRFGRRASFVANSLIVVFALALAVLANVALYTHDVHFDLTREGAYTPPEQAQSVVRNLSRDVRFIYFYHDDDPQALRAKDLLQALARSNERFHLRVIDPDTDPALARRYQIRFYNTAVVEADGQRATVENTTDLTQMAFAVVRALRQETKTVCFIVGHGEFFEPGGIQFHYTHTETLRAHDVEGGGDILEGKDSGLDRLYLALTNFGYRLEQIDLTRTSAIAPQCDAVVDSGPRVAYAPEQSRVLSDYLAAGGRLLLMYDPYSPIEPSFEATLERVGIKLIPAAVLDPTDHYATDPEKVAIPYYTPHPITEHLGLTFFPGVRPIVVLQPPSGVKLVPLFASTKDSYLRFESGALPVQDGSRAMNGQNPGPRVLAVAATGRWPGASAGAGPFRLVVIGDSDFATNAYFASVSNGTLVVAMIRWLVGDESVSLVKPETYAEPQIVLTNRQMKAVFAVVNVMLPLSVALIGTLVWWRRR
jgi:ABC-2 type transport system permease protein